MPNRQPSWITPGASPLRARIETASRGLLVRLAAAPRAIVFLGFLGLAVGTALAPGWWSVLCGAVLAGVLAWLLFLSWPRLASGQRAMRVLVIGVLLGLTIFRAATS